MLITLLVLTVTIFFARCRPRRVSGDPVDFLLPPVRAGGRIAFQLVAFRRLVRHDLFAIFAVFVFRICIAFASSSSAVATTTPAFATSPRPLLPPSALRAASNLVIWAVCVALCYLSAAISALSQPVVVVAR